jgi:hypothetical protein
VVIGDPATATEAWTYAGDNGSGVPGGAPSALSADELASITAPLAAEALWDEADVVASITPDEQAMIDASTTATD